MLRNTYVDVELKAIIFQVYGKPCRAWMQADPGTGVTESSPARLVISLSTAGAIMLDKLRQISEMLCFSIWTAKVKAGPRFLESRWTSLSVM